jgi:L-histidine Nalpha-methyltransferase
VPLDLSKGALRANAEAIAAAYPWVSVHGLVGDFERDQGLLPGGGRRLIAFLGSTIGNLDYQRRARFLSKLSETLVQDDALLLGLDLVKDPARLHAAYNDEGGVTEAFVRNALTAANRELGAIFDQERFAYEARWDPEHEWMEIGLRAREAHTVELPRLDLEIAFDADEFLRVEVSAKFRRDRVELELGRARLRIDAWWTDPEGDFALALAVP